MNEKKPVKVKVRQVTESFRRDEFIRRLMKGISPADAYIEAGYKPGTRVLAVQQASKLKRHPEVKSALQAFREVLDEAVPPAAVAVRLSQIVFRGDDRDALNAIKEINKISDRYPVAKQAIAVFRHDLAELE